MQFGEVSIALLGRTQFMGLKFGIFGGFVLGSSYLLVVMGQGSSPARARPGARVFSRARGPTFREGLKPGPARARGQKPGGFEGLSKYVFFF